MKNKLVKILVLAMSLVVAFSTTACKGKGNQDKGNRVQIEFRTNVPVDAKIPYIQAIKAYNEGQGVTDGVYVNAAGDIVSKGPGYVGGAVAGTVCGAYWILMMVGRLLGGIVGGKDHSGIRNGRGA